MPQSWRRKSCIDKQLALSHSKTCASKVFRIAFAHLADALSVSWTGMLLQFLNRGTVAANKRAGVLHANVDYVDSAGSTGQPGMYAASNRPLH